MQLSVKLYSLSSFLSCDIKQNIFFSLLKFWKEENISEIQV